jgi:ParE toxin of type II toxin-antitoxin system, parDE
MKSFTVIFSPDAIDDVEQTVDYYEKKQPGLGKRFATQLQLTLNAVKRNPFFASVRYNDIRCAGIKKFPYLVLYQINEDELLVTISYYHRRLLHLQRTVLVK